MGMYTYETFTFTPYLHTNVAHAPYIWHLVHVASRCDKFKRRNLDRSNTMVAKEYIVNRVFQKSGRPRHASNKANHSG